MITEVFIAVDRDEVYRATLPPGEYLIGRDPEAQIRIEHPTVSRFHAKLVVEDDSLVLADLDSGNGTMIEDSPVVYPSHFYEGQTARLGDVLLRARQNITPEALPPSIGSYRRGDIVAAGGMGAIHEARQSAMGRKVAMKVMLREESESGLRRFINEARITGMLEHPNIVPVHELGMDEEGRAFYTMKFVHGTTLAEVLAGLKTGHDDAVAKFTLSFLLTVFQKVCDAIAFAHNRGVHHRDLKPENVMIGDFGEVLVMDWGLSKESGFSSEAEEVLPASPSSDGEGWRTMDGSILGTPAYMSPEQARGEISAIDTRSDIYALGTILYEILYLQPPVSGNSAYDIVDKVARGELDPVREARRPHLVGGKVPPSLEAVRRKAMAYKPYQRYQHVTDLQADITAYQSGFATSAEGAGLGKHVLLFIKRNKGISIAVAAGIFSLIGSSVWFTANLMAALETTRVKERELARQLAQTHAAEKLRRDAESREANALQGEVQAKRESQLIEEKFTQAEISKEELEKQREETAQKLVQDAADFAGLARDSIAEGRANYAVQLSGAAVQYAPDNADHHLQHGRILLAVGRFREAAMQFEQAKKIGAGAGVDPELALAMRLRALSAADQQRSPEVADQLERFFMERGEGAYVRLVDAWRRGGSAGGRRPRDPDLGPDGVQKLLGGLVKQAGWRDSRIKRLEDQTFSLDLSGLDLKTAPDLLGAEVSELDLRNTAVRDISALRGLPLRVLKLRGSSVSDLSPLRNMPHLRELDCSEQVADLTPLRGVPLEVLDLSNSRVTDLSPLRDARLRVLRLNGCDLESFDPVVDQPIEELQANVGKTAELGPLARMSRLKKLELPYHAGSIDVTKLTELSEVTHPGLRPSGPISGEEYRQMEAERQGFWNQFAPVLERAGAKNLDPKRLVVRENSGVFDLDLRGTEIVDLRRLVGMPINRLWLDSSNEPLDVEPLFAHPTLNALSLVGANVPKLGRLADTKRLVSLALGLNSVDVPALANNSQLKRLGYKLSADELEASCTTQEFFGPRVPAEADGPTPAFESRHTFRFDSPTSGTEGWRIEDESRAAPPALWMADPAVEGGRGGGYLSFYERTPNGKTGYFEAAPIVTRNKRVVHGGMIEFQLRVGREVDATERVVVVLEGANMKLYHVSDTRPREHWRTILVPLTDAGRWRVGKPDGVLAADIQVRDVITKLDGVKIQAEYSTDNLEERTDLDDVMFWDARGAAARNAQFVGKQR